MSYVTTIQLPPSTEYVTQTEVFRKTVYTTSYVTVPYTTYLTDTVVLTQTVTTTVKAPQTLTTTVTPTTPTTVSPEVKNKLESDLSSIESKLLTVSTASDLTALLSKYDELLRSYNSLGVRIPDVEVRLDRVRKSIQDKVVSIVSSELSKVRPEDPEISRRLLDSLKNWLNSISKTYGVDVTQALNMVSTAESKLMTTLVIQELRGKVLPQVSELESQIPKITLKNELVDALNKLNSILSTYSTYKARGVSDPELESRLEGVKKAIQDKLYLITINELTSLDLRDLNVARMRVNNFETWLNSLKQYGISIPKDIEDAVSNAKAQIDSASLLKSEAYSKLSVRDREALDFIASKLARLYTTAEFLSKDTWNAIRSSLGLTDDNINLIMRYVRGEKLSDKELRKLADIYVNLQLNKTLDNEAIVKEIEKRIPIYTIEGIMYAPPLSEYEKELKERILKGEVPQVTPGRQITWAIEDTLKLTDLVSRGYGAVYSFLRDKGLPPGIASAIASALVTAGVTAVSMVPVVGAPLALGLIGASLANFTAQTLETLTDEYERKVFTEEFSKIIDPSKAPPEQRAIYEELRQELIGSIAGAVAGGVGAVGISKLTPKIAEKLSTLLKNKYPQLAEKLSNMASTSSMYGEPIAKTQNWQIMYNPDTKELLIVRVEAGTIKPVAKAPANQYLLTVASKSPDDLTKLVEAFVKITGKSDVTDELSIASQKLIESMIANKIPVTDTTIKESLTRYANYIKQMYEVLPEELRSRSLTEYIKQTTFVRVGDKLTPTLDLGTELVGYIGDKPVRFTKGALASLEVTDRLKNLGVFDDVVSLLQRGITGEKGVIVKPEKGLMVEVYPDGRLVITRGLQKETYSVFDPKYLMEARRLLETYDPTVLKAVSSAVTAPYTATPPPQPVTTPVKPELTDQLMKSISEKVGSSYKTIALASKDKTAYTYVATDLFKTGDEGTVLTALQDFIFAERPGRLEGLIRRVPEYERLTLYYARFDKGVADKLTKNLDLTKPLTIDDLRKAVSEAMKTASGGELAQLKQLQLILESRPNAVVPITVASTDEGIKIAVATATASLSKLTPEDIQKLGLEEKALVEGLKPVYIETTYPVPVTQPYEVTQPVYIPETIEIPFESSESVSLKPIYIEVPYLIPVSQTVRMDYPVFMPESVEVPFEAFESVRLKPFYVDVSYPVPVTQPYEVTQPVYIPETIEIPFESSESVSLKPIYIEVPYLIPVSQTVRMDYPVFMPESVEVPTAVDETVMLKPVYVEEVYTIPILKEVQRTELVTQPEEVVVNLVGKQLADVVVVPVEIPSFITVYYPYSEPLPIPPQILPAIGAVPTPPTTPKPSPEELKTRPEVKKAREVEKIVL